MSRSVRLMVHVVLVIALAGMVTAQTAPQAPVRVGGSIREPLQTKNVPPVYPPDAKRAGIQGIVLLEVVIGTNGKVTDARVLRPIQMLTQAAIDAVRQWEYSPTLLNGQPVPVVMTVSVAFMASDPPAGQSGRQGGQPPKPDPNSPAGAAAIDRVTKMIDLLKAHRSVAYETDGTFELLGDGLTIKASVGMAFAYSTPGKARVDIKAPVGLRMLTVSDGVTTWTYNGAVNTYTKKVGGIDLSAILAESQYTNMASLIAEMVGGLKIKTTTLRDETITIGGSPRLCSVVESRLDALDLPAPVPVDFSMKNMVSTEWADKQLGLPVKSTASFQVNVGPGMLEIRISSAMKSLKVDEALPPDTFTFTPPPNAREIKDPGGMTPRLSPFGPR